MVTLGGKPMPKNEQPRQEEKRNNKREKKSFFTPEAKEDEKSED